MFKFLIYVGVLVLLTNFRMVNVDEAIVTVVGVPGATTESISGKLTLIQKIHGVIIEGIIEGLPVGKHGLTVHAVGDVSGGVCGNVGDHFNPHNTSHGNHLASQSGRHVGDLGNIEADASGIATVKITDIVISLNGVNQVVGKAVVVDANEDDFGKGTGDNAEESKKTGNVGAPIACGIVGVVHEDYVRDGNFGVGLTIFIVVVAGLFRAFVPI